MILFILGFLLSISLWIPKGNISHWTIVFDAFIKACLAFSTAVYVCTEILSLFNALNAQNLWIAYGLACLLMGRRAWATYQQTQFPPLPKLPKLGVGLLVLLGILLAEALYFPPNNYDSMSYHMSRVAHWAQNGNVDFYPTGIARQLFSSPLAEYLILHSYLMQGSDLWANSFQWAALVINLPGQPKAIAETLEGLKDENGKAIVPGIFAAVPYCIDLIGGPYMETRDEFCKGWRPKTAVKSKRV